MSLYNSLMEMVIGEESISDYKERQALNEFKFLEKIGHFVKDKLNIKDKAKENKVTNAKYNIAQIKSTDQFKKLYLTESLCRPISKDRLSTTENGILQRNANLLVSLGAKEPITFYYFTGKDMNNLFDLSATKYDDETYFVAINFVEMSLDMKYAPGWKQEFQFRYFNDVVDNNEYHEFSAGRHPYTKQIEWLYNYYEQQGIKQRPKNSKATSNKKYGLGLSTDNIMFNNPYTK